MWDPEHSNQSTGLLVGLDRLLQPTGKWLQLSPSVFVRCQAPVNQRASERAQAIRTAQAQGLRFAIVTIWPPALRFIYDAILADTNAGSDCLAIYHLSEDSDLATLDQADNFVSEM